MDQVLERWARQGRGYEVFRPDAANLTRKRWPFDEYVCMHCGATMDTLTFISNMTSALAWPVVVGGVAYFYRAQLQRIFGDMKKLKLGPVEAEMFEREAREAKMLASELPLVGSVESAQTGGTSRGSLATAPAPDVGGATAPEGVLLDLVLEEVGRANFRFAVVRIWSVLEDALRSLAERSLVGAKGPVTTTLLELERRNLITRRELKVLRRLFELRNDAQHGYQVVSEDAFLDYLFAAGAILRRIGFSNQPGRSDDLRASPLGVTVKENE